MVPWWTLLLLTAVFFIREVYIRSRQKPNDFDSGYRQAIEDVVNKWNYLSRKKCTYEQHCQKMRDFLQNKLTGK